MPSLLALISQPARYVSPSVTQPSMYAPSALVHTFSAIKTRVYRHPTPMPFPSSVDRTQENPLHPANRLTISPPVTDQGKFESLKTHSLPPPHHLSLYRQLGIPHPQPRPVNSHANVRPHDGHVAREAGDGAEEVAKQHHDAVQLDEEADQRPLEQDQRQPGEEGGCALELLLAREEDKRLLRADDDG